MSDTATQKPVKLRDLAETVGEFLTFKPDIIDVEEGFNARHETPDYLEYIRELANSIKARGFLREKPLIVRRVGDRLVVTDGHGRLRAARLAIEEGAEIKAIPCIVEDRHTSEADRTLALIATNNGRPLSALEQAEVVKRLISYDWSEADIARKLGKSASWVANLLTLSAAPVEVRRMVVAGEVSATEAVRVVRSNGPDASTTLAAARDHARAAGKSRITAANTRAVDTRAASGPAPRNAAAWKVVGKAGELLELWEHSPALRQKVTPEFADAMEALRKAIP